MPLAAPTDVTITGLHRINTGATIDFYGNITWTVSEVQNHYIELELTTGTEQTNSEKIVLSRGSTKVEAKLLTSFPASSEENEKTINVSVRCRSALEVSNAATNSVVLSLSAPTVVSSPLAYDGDQDTLVTPTLSGVIEVVETQGKVVDYTTDDTGTDRIYYPAVNSSSLLSYGTLEWSALGASEIVDWSSAAASYIAELPNLLTFRLIGQELRGWRNYVYAGQQLAGIPKGFSTFSAHNILPDSLSFEVEAFTIYRKGLRSGDFYSVTASLYKAQMPTRSGGVWVNSYTREDQKVSFEFKETRKQALPPSIGTNYGPGVNAYVGVPFSFQIEATNKPISYGASGLPGGLSVNTTTGLVFGTATAPSSSAVTISATNIIGTTSAQITLIASAPLPTFTCELNQTGAQRGTFVGQPFKYELQAGTADGVLPVVFGVNFGSAAGLTFYPTLNVISGTVNESGTYSIPVSATNRYGTTDATLALEVKPFAAYPTSARVKVNTPFRARLIATHPANWQISSSGLAFGTAIDDLQIESELNETYLTGTPKVEGFFPIGIIATRTGTQETASSVANVTSQSQSIPPPKTILILGNEDVVKNGLSTQVNQSVNLVFQAALPTAPTKPASGAEWSVTGLPPGVALSLQRTGLLVSARLSGAPNAAGTYIVTLSGQIRAYALDAGKITFQFKVSPPLKTRIVTNPGWLNNGFSFQVGDRADVQFITDQRGELVVGQPRPIGASWRAVGLPDGLTMNANTGLVSGIVSKAGRFLATIFAHNKPLSSWSESDPVTITFTVRPAAGVGAPGVGAPGGGGGGPGGGVNAGSAAARLPWILEKWNLTDIQVFARNRNVESTLFSDNKLKLKIGDNINFAVFFIGGNNVPFQLAPSRLRLTIRLADSLDDDTLVFESQTLPAAVTTEPDPYYLLAASTAGRERQIVQEWVEDTGKNDPLPCVADIDWIKDGQHFSSASFPVLLELDVTRP